jgi:Response regulators consisting of a CheY-like receiver domain and a winged-helix DNA-binding domain
MRLLMADDDANTINLLCKYLNEWHYDVVTAGNGIEALDIIKRKIKRLFKNKFKCAFF